MITEDEFNQGPLGRWLRLVIDHAIERHIRNQLEAAGQQLVVSIVDVHSGNTVAVVSRYGANTESQAVR